MGEINSTTYICNGVDGINGTNGTNGTDGTNGLNTLVAVAVVPVGDANCAYGGNKLTSGSDANVNGTLDVGEINATTYICNGVDGANGTNGTDGTNGLNTLVETVTLLVGDANCAYGGSKATSGLDANVNGTLDAGEVSSTSYICNGADGINGTDGTNGTNGLNTLVETLTLLVGDANCAYGGSRVTSGSDANVNGTLDLGEINATTYICNGADGTNGTNGTDGTNGLNTLVETVTLLVGDANCAYGGNRITGGSDANVNGILDAGEVVSTSYVCNGADGINGADGTNGTNGLNTLVAIASVPVGDANCAYGGSKATSGLDANANGILDAGEVSSTSYVCNGADGIDGTNGTDGTDGTNGTNGTNGLNTLVETVTLLVGDANCAYGGSKITSGLDADANSVLDPGEVSSTTYVCNGATGGGLAAYAYVYNLTAQVVAVGATVQFDSDGVLLGVTHPSADTIQVASAGAYEIAFSLSGSEANQFALFVNGVVVPGSIYGSGAGTQQNSGQVIVILGAGDNVTLVNYGSAAAVSLPSVTGGTQANVNASIVIQKLD